MLHVFTASNFKVIVAAIASSAYVKAAVEAGFDVVSIDAFVDIDTQRLAKHCYQIDLYENQLDNEQLLKVLDSLDLQQFVGFCYGAGFEKSPEILTQINKRITVLGNTAKVVEKCKALVFFKLCDSLGIPHPPVVTERPLHIDGWLQKEMGGSGGGHIKQLSGKQEANLGNVYYQKLQGGKSVSCLFLASANDVQVIGFSEQWLDANEVEPFRYGGAVSHAAVSKQAKVHLTDCVRKLSQAIGLVGLNSCDVICNGNDIYVLEINPRLSATIDLYRLKQGGLMAMHIASSQLGLNAGLTEQVIVDREISMAHQVIYAKHDISIGCTIVWPSWVSDVPEVGSIFSTDMPVCTVHSEAKTPLLAKKMVQDRAVALNRKLLT